MSVIPGLYGSLGRGETSEVGAMTAGRVVSSYLEGARLRFVTLNDGTAEMQVIVTPDRVGQDGWELAAALSLGQWAVASGVVTRTRRGVLSILADSIRNGGQQ